MSTTYTYFIGGDGADSLVKIGKSFNPEARLRSLQLSSPVQLELIGVVPRDVESELHERFKSFRKHGEWFQYEAPIREWVAQNCKSYTPSEHTKDPVSLSGGSRAAENTTIVSSPWLRKSEAAEYVGVSTRAIDNWRQEGLLFSMVGGTVLIHRDDLDDFIRGHQARTIARRHRVRATA